MQTDPGSLCHDWQRKRFELSTEMSKTLQRKVMDSYRDNPRGKEENPKVCMSEAFSTLLL